MLPRLLTILILFEYFSLAIEGKHQTNFEHRLRPFWNTLVSDSCELGGVCDGHLIAFLPCLKSVLYMYQSLQIPPANLIRSFQLRYSQEATFLEQAKKQIG